MLCGEINSHIILSCCEQGCIFIATFKLQCYMTHFYVEMTYRRNYYDTLSQIIIFKKVSSRELGQKGGRSNVPSILK